uniref:Uncharacterized protein n=1 Tax=Strigamia maritima TaxID=126957 RepID=T1JKC5_STRMM
MRQRHRILNNCLRPPSQSKGDCFPSNWIGSWFQSGTQVVHITSNDISTKGECVQFFGENKYAIRESNGKCYRCMAIHSKHYNVLQYKETTDCDKTSADVCSQISGDAPLYSLFRVDAAPVPCPFKGPYTFAYNRGYLECSSPVSNMDTCMEDSRVLFRFQACPDVAGTESTVEELVCIANWKESAYWYLIGKLKHKMANTEEEQYRCFVYEKNKEHDHAGFQLAQSGDATCNGLLTPFEGLRTMRLNKTVHPPMRCQFPSWITHTHHWHTLDGRKYYTFSQRNNSLKVTNSTSKDDLELKALCTEELTRKDRLSTIVAHVTSGCENGYVCMEFHKRSNHVIEVQSGNFTRLKSEACHTPYFNRSSAEFVTLITGNPTANECPYLGKYNLLSAKWQMRHDRNEREVCQEFSTLRVGCERIDTIEFETNSYECHASWKENQTNYLITSIKGTRNRFCFIYMENDKVLQFSSLQGSCNRNTVPGVSGLMAFNVTSNGRCMDIAGSARSVEIASTVSVIGMIAMVVWIYVKLFVRLDFKMEVQVAKTDDIVVIEWPALQE